MTLAVVVGVLAAVGAVARYAVDQWVQSRHEGAFPWGTLVVNASGSFVFAAASGLVTHHGLDPGTGLALTAGFAGGYTTWSTYVWECLALGESGALLPAAANLVGSLAVGLLAAAGGFALAAV